MNINKILYQTTRGIYSVEDKLSIGTVFLFCYKFDALSFAELLYTNDHKRFINGLNREYSKYEVDFNIRLDDRNVLSCFNKTIEEVKAKYDNDGFYKALFEKDKFALVIYNMLKYDFSKFNINTFARL